MKYSELHNRADNWLYDCELPTLGLKEESKSVAFILANSEGSGKMTDEDAIECCRDYEVVEIPDILVGDSVITDEQDILELMAQQYIDEVEADFPDLPPMYRFAVDLKKIARELQYAGETPEYWYRNFYLRGVR